MVEAHVTLEHHRRRRNSSCSCTQKSNPSKSRHGLKICIAPLTSSQKVAGSIPYIYELDERSSPPLKGNCHKLRMHLSKVVCGNMPGFLATFRSRNLLFYRSYLFRHQRPVICGRFCFASMPPWIKLEKFRLSFSSLNCSWQFPFKSDKLAKISELYRLYIFLKTLLNLISLGWIVECLIDQKKLQKVYHFLKF